jgi:hypothetical protein
MCPAHSQVRVRGNYVKMDLKKWTSKQCKQEGNTLLAWKFLGLRERDGEEKLSCEENCTYLDRRAFTKWNAMSKRKHN